MSDLSIAYNRLSQNAREYGLWWRYYDGDQPLLYTAKRLEEAFRRLDTTFVQNWCAVVVDSALERMVLKGFTIEGDKSAETRANELWRDTDLTLDDVDTHRAALVCGESYVVAWRDEGQPIEAYYHDARSCCVQYDPAHPREKLWGAKWWDDEADGLRHLTIYYRDRLDYYISTKKPDSIKSDKDFALASSAPNPYDVVPVFHFRRERRAIRSELANVRSLQDAENKLLSDMMVAAEFGAFKQRWIISGGQIGDIKNGPNEIWDLPAGDGSGQGTQVGEFSETNLTQFLDAMDRLSRAIGVISRTPRHYFFAQAGDPSGEALIAMEAPLNKKVSRYLELFQVPWQRVMAFLLQMDGYDVAPSDIGVVWERPETVQPRTQAEIRQLNKNAGIPVATSLRWEGMDQARIDAMQDDASAEQARGIASFGAMQVEMERRAAQQQDGA